MMDQQFSFLWSRPGDPYVRRLRREFGLRRLVAGSGSEYEVVQAICRWAHSMLIHDSAHEPRADDPISILREAKKGAAFRCVEFSTVIQGCLTALGIPARNLGLKTRDVETRVSEAGHVVVEAYLWEMEKWIMCDGQFDTIPIIHGAPINAVELRRGCERGEDALSVLSQSGTRAEEYLSWIGPYLYYFDIRRDNRVGVRDRLAEGIMLIPSGAGEPKVMQRRWPIEAMTYTRSKAAFYASPQ